MLTHAQVWSAIDALAERNGMSASGLARAGGLDPTTFNRSKRLGPDGRQRWPSTESLAKVLEATDSNLNDFLALLRQGGESGERPLPMLTLREAALPGNFNLSGLPAGAKWTHISFPDFAQDGAYALAITGDTLLPLYRDGDVLIVQPGARIRRGDRLMARMQDGSLRFGQLKRKTALGAELKSFSADQPDVFLPQSETSWLARIAWASQ